MDLFKADEAGYLQTERLRTEFCDRRHFICVRLSLLRSQFSLAVIYLSSPAPVQLQQRLAAGVLHPVPAGRSVRILVPPALPRSEYFVEGTHRSSPERGVQPQRRTAHFAVHSVLQHFSVCVVPAVWF